MCLSMILKLKTAPPDGSFLFLCSHKLSHFTFIASIRYYWFGNDIFLNCEMSKWLFDLFFFFWGDKQQRPHNINIVIQVPRFTLWPSQVEPIMVIYFCFRINYKGNSAWGTLILNFICTFNGNEFQNAYDIYILILPCFVIVNRSIFRSFYS